MDAPTTVLPVADDSAERIARLRRPVRTRGDKWRDLVRRIAPIAAIAAVGVLSVKPFLDILGERAGPNDIDIGTLVTAFGAALMAAGMLGYAFSADRIPRPLVLVLAMLGALLVLSCVSYLALPGRGGLLALFDKPRHAMYGVHLDPHGSIPTEAVRLVTSYAPIAMIAVMLKRQSVPSGRVLRIAAHVIVAAAMVHCVIAWLQVVGVVHYSFYFQLPGVYIGRPSGGYYHPMSLGRLLIFSVVILYVLRDRLNSSNARHYALVGLFMCTATVSLHRLTILCIAFAVVAFELPRLRRIEWRTLNRKLVLRAAAAAAGLIVLVGVVWGDFIVSRGSVMLAAVGSWDVGSDRFLNGRGAIWSDVAGILGRSTWDIWLFGFGYEPWDMHNDLLRVGVVWGLSGIVLTLTAMIMLYRFTRGMITKQGRWLLATIYLILIIFGLTLKPTSYPYFMWLFLFCHMLIIAFHRASPVSHEGPEKSERLVSAPHP